MSMRYLQLITLGLLGTGHWAYSPGAVCAGGSYDVAADFSSSSNPNGAWSFGSMAELGASLDLFTLHDQALPGIFEWHANVPLFGPVVALNGNATPLLLDNSMVAAPGQFFVAPGTPDFVVTRWIAASSGKYAVSSLFTGIQYDVGTTVDVHVLLNGSSIYDGYVDGFAGSPYVDVAPFGPLPQQSFSTVLNISAGDVVDFAVGNGSNGQVHDGTGVSIQIQGAVPEPSALILMTCSIPVGMYFVGRSRAGNRQVDRKSLER